MADNVTPMSKINLNLDTAEREKSYEPFVVVIDGRSITMTDPAELDWKDLLAIEQPSEFFRHCMSEDDQAFLRKTNIPGWKFRLLLESYQRHYGLDIAGNRAASRI